MKQKKNQKGISMVSLVITIIIILILTGIIFVTSLDTIGEADYSKYVSNISDVNTAFKETSTSINGEKVAEQKEKNEVQVYNYVAKGGKEESDFLVTNEVPVYTILKDEEQIGIKLPEMTVESGTGKRVPVTYATTKGGQIFTWPPYDYEDQYYITSRDTVESKMQTDITVGNESFKIEIDPVYGTLKDVVESMPTPPEQEPDIPDIPEIPEIPETPENPETPDTPNIPENPENPETPDKPEVHVHDFSSEIATTEYLASKATCTSAATYYYKCTGCDEKSTNTYTSGNTLGHDFNDKEISEKYLASKATCADPATYYYKCTRCEEKGSRAYTEGAELGHTYGEYEVVEIATCAQKGLKKRTCIRCTAFEKEEIPKDMSNHVGETISKIEKEATCTDEGTEKTYCKSCDALLSEKTIEALGHEFTMKSKTEEYKKEEATCTKGIIYYYKCTRCDEKGTETYEAGESLGHEYNNPTFNWSEDLSNAKATFECKENDDTKVVTAQITSKITTEPTCEENGERTYTATVKFKEKTYIDTKTQEVEPIGHTYGDPNFNWSDDFSSADAEFVCNCGKVHTEKAEISVNTKNPTCEEEGENKYTANVTFGDKNYSGIETEVIPSTGHTGTTDFEWSDDYSKATAIFTCVCGEKESVDAQITSNTINSTCTENGKITYKATAILNGNEYTSTKTKLLPKAEHTFGEYEMTKEANCQETGIKERYCSVCNYLETTVIDKDMTKHIGGEIAENVKEATCTETGKIEYKCEKCYRTTKTEVVQSLGHDFKEEKAEEIYLSQEATCTRVATYFHKCTRCAEHGTSTYEYGEVLGHEFSAKSAEEKYLVTEATCTALAKYYYKCVRCDEKGTEIYEHGEVLDHIFTRKEMEEKYLVTEATCTTPASYYYKCENCDAKGTDIYQHGNALGHEFTETIEDAEHLASEATCILPATYYYNCVRCDEKGIDTYQSGEALGHSFGEYEITKPANCTEIGIKERICTSCELKETEEIAIDSTKHHGEENKEIVTEATCTETGVTKYTCSSCNAELRTEEISATGHTFGEYEITKPANCTETGIKERICISCELKETEEIEIDLTKHHGDENAETVLEATCTEAGLTKYTCSSCNTFLRSETNVKLGHDWNNETPRICNRCKITEPSVETALILNQPYVATIEGNIIEIVFRSNGAIDVWLNDLYGEMSQEGYIEYEETSIIIAQSGDTLGTISEDGTQIIIINEGTEVTFELKETEKGYIQYGKMYSLVYNGMAGAVVFNADGSATINTGSIEEAPAGTITYKENSFEAMAVEYPVYPDGSKIMFDGMILKLTETPIVYDMPYGTVIGGGSIDLVFHEDGSADAWIMDLYGMQMPATYLVYTEDSIVIPEMGEALGSIINNGTQITGSVDGIDLILDLKNIEKQGIKFGKEYSFMYEDMSISGILYEDGSAILNQNGQIIQYPAGSIKYNDSVIEGEGLKAPIYPDGTKIMIEEMILVIRESLRYGEPYSMASEDGVTKTTIVFYENGAADMYVNSTLAQSMPEGTLVYENSTIAMKSVGEDGEETLEVMGKISPDGTQVIVQTMEGILNFGFVLESEETPVHIGKKYEVKMEGETQMYLVFHEDGSADMYTPDNVYAQTMPVAVVYGENNVINFSGIIISVSKDGSKIVLMPGMLEMILIEEYGVLFEKIYSTTTANGDKISYVFYKDGTVKYYVNNILQEIMPEGTANYTDTAFTMNDETITPTEGKTKFELNGVTYTLENATGVVYNANYSATDGTNKYYIFNEDKTAKYYENGILVKTIPGNEVVIGDGIIIIGNTYGTISEDMKEITYEGTKYVMSPKLAAGDEWYKSNLDKCNDIRYIEIVDSYIPDGSELQSWNADAYDSGVYKGYILSDGRTVLLAGDGTGSIKLNEDSSYMFDGFSNVDFVDISLFDTTNVTNMSYMFAQLNIEEFDFTNFNTSKVTNMSRMFYNCRDLTNINFTNIDTSNVTDMSYMFMYCEGFTSIDLSLLNTSNVTNMSGLFYECDGLTSIEWGNIDTSKVTDMSSMFYNCDGLKTIDVSSLNTSNVKNMNEMFKECSNITSLDLSDWETSNVADMSYMFSNDSKLNTIYVSAEKWSNSKVTTTYGTFDNCVCIVGGEGTAYENGNTSARYACIDGGIENPGYLTDIDKKSNNDSILAFGENWYRGTTAKSSITTINIMEGYTPDGTELESWNADINNNGGIKAYILADGCTLVLADVDSEKITANTNSSYMFTGFTKLTSINGFESLDTTKVVSMSYMFSGCSSLKELDFTRLNTTKVTNMSGMFNNCDGIQTIDLSTLNTENVTNMSYMFYDCDGLNQVKISDFNLDTSSVTNMSYMFSNCSNLTNIDFTDFDMSKVTNMSYMFENCMYLKNVNFANINTINVTDMSYMFDSCSYLKEIEFGSIDTSNVTTMSHMFYNCRTAISLDLTGLNTTNVRNMSYMFWSCDNLVILDLSSFDTSSLYTMSDMFRDCPELSTIFVSDKWNTSGITNSYNMGGMFSNDTKLIGGQGTVYDSTHTNGEYARIDGGISNPGYFTDINDKGNYSATLAPKGSWYKGTQTKDTITKIKFVENYEADGTELELWNADMIDAGGIKAYILSDCTTLVISASEDSTIKANRNSSNLFYGFTKVTTIENLNSIDTSEVTDMSYMFYDCDSLTTIELSIDTSKVTSMSYMFGNCDKLTKFNLNINTSNVTDMSYMFYNCSSLKTWNIENLDTTKVTNMSGMFSSCEYLTSINLSNFNTSNVTDMYSMFSNCDRLTGIDLSSFDTSNVTRMNYMFYYCSNLCKIFVSDKWNTTNVQYSSYMFYRTNKLVGGEGTVYSDSYTDATYAHIDYGTSNPGYLTGTEKLEEFSKTLLPNSMWYNASVNKDTITKVEFTENYIPDGTELEAWNADLAYAGGIKAYRLADGKTIVVTSTNNEDIIANTDLSNMFNGFTALKCVDFTGLDTTNVTNMNSMFYNCSKLNTIFAGTNWNTENVTNSANMFSGVSNIVGEAGTIYNSSYIDITYAHVDGGTENPGYFTDESKVALYSQTLLPTNTWYLGSTYKGYITKIKLVENYIPDGTERETWNADMAYSGGVKCYILADNSTVVLTSTTGEKIKANPDSSNAFSATRYYMNGSTEQNEYNFRYLRVIENMNLLDVSLVTNMSYMFAGAKMTMLDLRDWDTTNVTTMKKMFCNCSMLSTIYANETWTTENTEITYDVFDYCSVIIGGKGTIYNSSAESTTYARIDGGTSTPGYFTEYDSVDSGDDVLAVAATWYKATIEKSNITTINIVDSYIPDGTEITIWNADQNNTGSIKAYILSDGKTLVLSGNGKGSITANENSVSMFANFSKLTSINGLDVLDTSKVTNMSKMFYYCSNIRNIDISSLDTENVTSMNSMFDHCSSLITVNIANLNIGNLTDTTQMFYYCDELTTIYSDKDWNISTLKKSTNMFFYCIDIVGGEGSELDTTYSKTRARLDGGASKIGYFTHVSKLEENNTVLSVKDSWFRYNTYKSNIKTISFVDNYTPDGTEKASWNADVNYSGRVKGYLLADGATIILACNEKGYVTASKNMTDAFRDFTQLTTINGFENLDTTQTKDMSWMFYSCESLQTIDLSALNTPNLRTLEGMFIYCSALQNVNVYGLETSNVTNMSYVFADCTALKTINLGSFDTLKVTDISGLFRKDTALTTVYISEKWDVSNVTKYTETFSNCTNLKGYKGTTYNSSNNVIQYACIDEGLAKPGYFTPHIYLTYPNTSEGNTAKPNVIVAHEKYKLANATPYYELIDGSEYVTLDSSTGTVTGLVDGRATIKVTMTAKDGTTISATGNAHVVEEYFAVYSETDNSLTFYNRKDVATEGETYNGKEVTKLYSGFNHAKYINATQVPWYSERESITSVKFADVMSPYSTAYWFDGFVNCSEIDLTNLDTSRTENMNYTFRNTADNMTEINFIGIGELELSNVEDMTGLFYSTASNATNFEMDLSQWDTDNVKYMQYMFMEAGYNAMKWSLGDISDWNTSNVINMSNTFNGIAYNKKGEVKFNESGEIVDYDVTDYMLSLDLGGWDVSNVTDMSYTFANAGRNVAYEVSVDITNWNTSNVTNMNNMFEGYAYSANEMQIVGITELDVTSVEQMKYMFSNAAYEGSKITLDLSGWDTSNVKYMYRMFNNFMGDENPCMSISLNLSNWNLSKVTDIGGSGNFFNNTANMIQDYEIILDNWIAPADISYLFTGLMTNANCGETRIELKNWDTSKVTNVTGLFYNFLGKIQTTVIAEGLDLSKATGVTSIFNAPEGYVGNITLDLKGWKVTGSIGSMFREYGMDVRKMNIDLSDWDTTNVTKTTSMFLEAGEYCDEFVVNLSGWDVSNVTEMSAMFRKSGMTADKYIIDFTGWVPSNVTNMNYMFDYAGYSNEGEFKLIGIEDWDVSSVTEMEKMFYGTATQNTEVVLDLSKWDVSNVTKYDNFSWFGGTMIRPNF